MFFFFLCRLFSEWLRSETEALTADDVQAFPWGILNISYPSSSSSASVVQDVTRCPYPGISQEDLDGFPPSSSSGSFSFPSSKTFDDFVAELTGTTTPLSLAVSFRSPQNSLMACVLPDSMPESYSSFLLLSVILPLFHPPPSFFLALLRGSVSSMGGTIRTCLGDG